MKTTLFKVQNRSCGECSLALRRFTGGMQGIHSIEVASDKIAVKFDDSKIDEEELAKIAKNSIEQLGYKDEKNECSILVHIKTEDVNEDRFMF